MGGNLIIVSLFFTIQKMKKKIIAYVVNDIHLSIDNYIQREELFDQIFSKISSNEEIHHLIILGDVFQSRIAQRMEVLNSFARILKKARLFEIDITCIPGNHDKTNYSSHDSFLDVFCHHEGFWLINNPVTMTAVYSPDVKFVFIPFYDEQTWHDLYIKHVESLSNDKHILFTHIAVNGSVNNDNSIVRSNLNQDLFKKHFEAVFSGHYHNHQNVGIFHHLPSICQSNFGEDEVKGFTAIYDDLSYSIIKLDFDKYLTLKIDLNNVSKKDIQKEINKYKDSYKYLRVEFIGDESQLKSIDTKYITSQGIDVKFKQISVKEEDLSAEFIKFNNESILDEFKLWCEKEQKEYEQGVEYLKKKLT